MVEISGKINIGCFLNYLFTNCENYMPPKESETAMLEEGS
jgi:hypothetical protein